MWNNKEVKINVSEMKFVFFPYILFFITIYFGIGALETISWLGVMTSKKKKKVGGGGGGPDLQAEVLTDCSSVDKKRGPHITMTAFSAHLIIVGGGISKFPGGDAPLDENFPPAFPAPRACLEVWLQIINRKGKINWHLVCQHAWSVD